MQSDNHFTLAEQGKRLAVKQRHADALVLYRDALRLAQQQSVQPIILRHYTECILESLERMGDYRSVILYCDESIAHYQQHPPQSDLAKRDLAAINERKALVCVKAGDLELAQLAIDSARMLADDLGIEMPLLNKLMGWLRSRLHISIDRIEKEQTRAGYFSVRADTLSSLN